MVLPPTLASPLAAVEDSKLFTEALLSRFASKLLELLRVELLLLPGPVLLLDGSLKPKIPAKALAGSPLPAVRALMELLGVICGLT